MSPERLTPARLIQKKEKRMSIPWLLIGKSLIKLWRRRIKKKWKKTVLKWVQTAAVQFGDSGERRRWVRKQLMDELGLSEAMARKVTEWGVNKWKSLS